MGDAGGLLRAAYREFGCWRAAVVAAGVKYPGRKRWPKEEVIRELEHRRRKGLPLNPGAVNRSQPGLYDAGIRIFGSWDRAVRVSQK